MYIFIVGQNSYETVTKILSALIYLALVSSFPTHVLLSKIFTVSSIYG